MPWSSGTYTRTNGTYTGSGVWQSDAAASVKIRADRHDTHDQDLASGINACLNKNGENSPTANINWGGFKITNVGNGSAASDIAAYGQTITAFSFDSGTNVLTATRSAGDLTVDLSALAGGGGSGGAPVDAQYLTLAANGTLTNESVLSANNGVQLTTGTGTATLSLTTTGVSAGTYNLATITVDSRGRITSASSGSAGAGTVTSVNATSASTAALTVSGGPITGSGTFTFTVDPALVSIAGLTTAANKMIYTTAADTYAVADLTAAGRALLDDADASAQRTTLGLGSWATKAQTVSTSTPSGTPAAGDVWIQYIP